LRGDVGIAPYAEVVGKGRNFARLPLTRELSSDSETEGEIRLRQHLSRAIFSLSLRLFAAQKSTSLVRGRLAPAARCQNRSIFHLIRFAALSTFFSRNGPLLSAAPTFPPRAGELPPRGRLAPAIGLHINLISAPTSPGTRRRIAGRLACSLHTYCLEEAGQGWFLLL